jgi:hypothetical protein
LHARLLLEKSEQPQKEGQDEEVEEEERAIKAVANPRKGPKPPDR